MTKRDRLRRVVLLCAHFSRNLAYYRAGHSRLTNRSPQFWITVDDAHLQIVRDHAAPLLPSLRSAFLQRVAQLLRGEREFAEGVVSRACRTAQAEFLARSEAPAIDGTG
jgi:hypothetical protein